MAVFPEAPERPYVAVRPFRTSEEYLYAMKEDLAEWLAGLYGLGVRAEDFVERLEDGVILCRHANRAIAAARDRGHPLGQCREVAFRPRVQPGTFHARDNVSNFIGWCRAGLRLRECLLFETDDLVMRKNERNVVLCLLEVARRGVGMPAPLLVQMEREIDAEIAADVEGGSSSVGATPPSSLALDSDGHEADDDSDTYSEAAPPRQIVTNDLRSLHERVADLLNRCMCPSQFPMLRVGDGKYRIGETQLLIFVRVLRNHVMVRVGGGWDTLEHYLDKHDPCRCRSGRRFSMSRISPSSSSGSGSIQLHITNHRPLSSGTPSSSRSSSVPTSPPSRRRSFDWSRLSSPDDGSPQRSFSRTGSSSDDYAPGTPQQPPRRQGGGRSKAATRPCSADSSSESEAYQRRMQMGRKGSPRKVPRVGEEPPQQQTSPRSRIPTSQSPSPRHRAAPSGSGCLPTSRSETSLFQSPTYRGRPPAGGAASRRPGRNPCRTASASPARTPSGDSYRNLSLQSSPVKPVPPLLEEILQDSEFLDSDEKILERMERLINAYRQRETDLSTEDLLQSQATSPSAAKSRRRSSLSRIPVFAWHVRQ